MVMESRRICLHVLVAARTDLRPTGRALAELEQPCEAVALLAALRDHHVLRLLLILRLHKPFGAIVPLQCRLMPFTCTMLGNT